jgi:hypothetical protein
MQISSASLLAAQQQASAQAKPQKSVFGSFLNASEAKPVEATKAQFEPADFAKAEPQKTAAAAAPEPARAYQRPGSALDIRV